MGAEETRMDRRAGATAKPVRRPRRLLSLTVTGALAAAGVVHALPAGAQTAAAAGQEARIAYAIPAQPLSRALIRFSEAAGVQLFFDADLLRGKRSSGVRGRLTRTEALDRLLAGSGLAYRVSGNTVTITSASHPAQGSAAADGSLMLDPIAVAGRDSSYAFAGGQVATTSRLGMLGSRPVMDTPFNVSSYTARTIEDQQSQNVADVTKNDPSVRATWAEGSYANQFFVRGFPLANPDISINGLYGMVPYQMAGTSWVERVEILKGPSALLNGMAPQGSVGGNFNLVPKRAGDTPLTRLTAGYISDSQIGGKVDVSRRFGADKAFGVRFNGAYSNGDAPVDGQKNELGEAALALDYRGERVRLSADLGYQKNYADNPARPIYVRPGFAVPKAPDASSNLGQSWYYADAEDYWGMVRGEFDITDNLTAYAAAGARRNDFLGLYNFSYLKNAAGDFDANNYYQPTYNESLTGEAGIRASFSTGPVRHELNVSATALYNELGAIAPVVSTYSSNIYNPGAAPFPDLTGRASKAPKTSASTLTSLAVADSLYFLDDRVQLILGGRYQNVRQKGWNATTGAQTADYDESAFTPAVGIVVKPWRNVSLYANYIEGLSQGPTAPAAAANSGEAFAPIKSKQYEAGIKLEHGGLGATLSVFQIEQPSGMLDPVTNIYGVDGEVRNRGVELNVFGEVTRGLRVLGGVAFMDGVQTKTVNGTNDGKKAIGIPDIQLNLGAEWDAPFLDGLAFWGRLIHTASQYASADNSQSIPDWTRADLGVRYTFDRGDGQPVTIRASVENVFDKSYWAAASSNFGLARGAPRTFRVSTTFDF